MTEETTAVYAPDAPDAVETNGKPEEKTVARSEVIQALTEQLEADRQERLETFAKGLGELRKATNCGLVAVPEIRDGRIVARIEIVPL